MCRSFLFGFVALVAALTLLPERAEAQYSVYVFNHRKPDEGWQRSQRGRSVNESLADCQKDIKSRLLQNKRSKRDHESFAIAHGHEATIDRPTIVVYVPPKWFASAPAYMRATPPIPLVIDPLLRAEEARRSAMRAGR